MKIDNIWKQLNDIDQFKNVADIIEALQINTA